MAKVYLRTYGGTGELISRALILLLMISPTVQEHNFDITNLDFDDATEGNITDYSIIDRILTNYHYLHNLYSKYFARSTINRSTATDLKKIRYKAYKAADPSFATLDLSNNSFSINEIFINNNSETEELILSVLSPEQIYESNKNGAYANPALNAWIAYPMRSHGYTDNGVSNGIIPKMNDVGDMVFYIGSTDGGTANTLLDPDLMSYCQTQLNGANCTRNAKVFSIRTLPYKRYNTDDNQKARATADNLIPQSSGVVANICSNENDYKNYYKRAGTAPNEKYLLDALVLVGYNVDSFSKLDDTNEDRTQAHFDNQYHQLHAVEITAATAVFDILNGAINTDPNNNCDRIAGYNVFNETEADGDLRITAYNFFAERDVLKIPDRIIAAIKLYAIVSLHLIPEFNYDKNTTFTKSRRRNEDDYPPVYLQRVFGIKGGRFKHYKPNSNDRNYIEIEQDVKDICRYLVDFRDNLKPFVEMIYQAQKCSNYGMVGEKHPLSIVDYDGLHLLLFKNEVGRVYDSRNICVSGGFSDDWGFFKEILWKEYNDELLNISYISDVRKRSTALLDLIYEILLDEDDYYTEED